MITVVNKKNHIPTKDDFYIGRGSPLGNQYTSITNRQTKAKFVCNSRDESVERFEIYLLEEIAKKNPCICNELNRIWKAAKKRDINLVCFCKPNKCHGDIIKRIIELKL